MGDLGEALKILEGINSIDHRVCQLDSVNQGGKKLNIRTDTTRGEAVHCLHYIKISPSEFLYYINSKRVPPV